MLIPKRKNKDSEGNTAKSILPAAGQVQPGQKTAGAALVPWLTALNRHHPPAGLLGGRRGGKDHSVLPAPRCHRPARDRAARQAVELIIQLPVDMVTSPILTSVSPGGCAHWCPILPSGSSGSSPGRLRDGVTRGRGPWARLAQDREGRRGQRWERIAGGLQAAGCSSPRPPSHTRNLPGDS